MKKLRTFAMDHVWAPLARWNFDHLIAPNEEDSLACRIGRRVDGELSKLFGFLYEGSDEEIRDAWEIPEEYCSEVQLEVRREALARSAEWDWEEEEDDDPREAWKTI
jgi:hypothetical protein